MVMTIPEDEDSLNEIIIDGACVGNFWSLYFDTFHRAGFHAQLVTVLGTGDIIDGIEAYKTLNQIIRQNNQTLIKVTCMADLYDAKRDGKLGVIYHMQGAENLGSDIDNLSLHYDLGLRVLQLAYNRRNYWCEGCLEAFQSTGLSNLGRRLITACNTMGVVIDGSHCSWGSVLEACEISDKPVICSHSNTYAVHPSRRNISDEVLCAIADTGGVVGVCGFPPFVSNKRPLTIDHVIEHIDHIETLVGIDYISLGLDYFFPDFYENHINRMIEIGLWDEETYSASLPWVWPKGLDDIAQVIPNLTLSLTNTGYSRSEIRKIFGLNLVRVFSRVWR